MDNEHSHPIKKEFYKQNSKVRKPDDQEMQRIVDQVKDSAYLKQITGRFNNDNNKNYKNNFQMSYAMHLISTKFLEMNILFRSCSWILWPYFDKISFIILVR